MTCACISIAHDYDGADLCVETLRRARKERSCCECRQRIGKGDQYEDARVLYDGLWCRFTTCAPCVEVRRAIFCDGWLYEGCWAEIEEHFREGATLAGCIARVESVAAREKLADAYRRTIAGAWKEPAL